MAGPRVRSLWHSVGDGCPGWEARGGWGGERTVLARRRVSAGFTGGSGVPWTHTHPRPPPHFPDTCQEARRRCCWVGPGCDGQLGSSLTGCRRGNRGSQGTPACPKKSLEQDPAFPTTVGATSLAHCTDSPSWPSLPSCASLGAGLWLGPASPAGLLPDGCPACQLSQAGASAPGQL